MLDKTHGAQEEQNPEVREGQRPFEGRSLTVIEGWQSYPAHVYRAAFVLRFKSTVFQRSKELLEYLYWNCSGLSLLIFSVQLSSS